MSEHRTPTLVDDPGPGAPAVVREALKQRAGNPQLSRATRRHARTATGAQDTQATIGTITLYISRQHLQSLRSYKASLPETDRLPMREILLGVLASTVDDLRARYGGVANATSPFGAPLDARRAVRRTGTRDATTLAMRLPNDVKAAIDDLASELGLSRSMLVNVAIELAIDRGLLPSS